MENRIGTRTRTYDLVVTGLFAAIVYVVTLTTHFPLPKIGIVPQTLVHLGDAAVYLAVMLLGTKRGTIASAIGMGLFDLLSPYVIWTPVTIIAKGGMALITGLIIYRNNRQGKNTKFNILGTTLAGIYMIAIYWLGGTIITMLTTKDVSIATSMVLNLSGIFGNVAQVALGIVVAVPLGAMVMRRTRRGI